MKNYLRLMRIRHYIKNLLIFLPIIFSGKASDFHLLSTTIAGFISFSLAASVVYIINDIHDLEYDRAHETKKERPLASGAVGIKQAWALVGILAFAAVVLIFAVLNSYQTWLLLLLYVLINIAYSYGLKNISLVDIVIIVAGFLIRVAFGGAIVGIHISSWMYLTVMAMSFYLAFGKRRNEIHRSGTSSRVVFKHYSEQFLDKMMYVSLGLTVMFYSMWCVTPNNMIREGNLIWTVPLVLLICMKYSMDVEGDSSGDPAEVLLDDKVLLLLIGLYGVFLMTLFYSTQVLDVIGI